MQKVLILGGTKFFGKRLVDLLLTEGMDVTIATRGLTPDPFGSSVKRIVLDRQDGKSMEEGLAEGEWDVVYDQTCYAPKEAADVYRILQDRMNRYVFTSTMAVYDIGENKTEADFDPYDSDYQLGERKDYADGMAGYTRAKRSAEAFLFQQASIPVAAIRFPVVIGPDDYTNRLRFYADRVLSGTPIGTPNPSARMSFISSEEASKFLYWAGVSDWTGPLNASSYGDVSHRDIVAQLERFSGTHGAFVPDAKPENQSPYGFPDTWTLNASKAASFGFTFKQLDDYLPLLLESYVKENVSSK